MTKLKLSLNQLLAALLFASIAALAIAYTAQYGFKLEPCILCIYQRLPFLAIIFLSSVALTFFRSKTAKKTAILISLILIAANVGIGLYHVGVEKKLFGNQATCSTQNNFFARNLEELELELLSAKISRCDQPSFFLLGLSMAQWAVIYYLFLLSGTVFLYRRRSKKA